MEFTNISRACGNTLMYKCVLCDNASKLNNVRTDNDDDDDDENDDDDNDCDGPNN